MAVSEKKLDSCHSEKKNTLSLLRSRKEKLRRKRIKDCYEQLRALLPHGGSTKDDVASVLEAAVDYMRYLQDRLPRDVTTQIAKALQKNRRCSKGRRSKNKVPPLFSPARRKSAASIKVMGSGEKTGLSTNKTVGLLCSTAADCCPREQTCTCQQDETVQPNCYMPVLCLPVMTSLLWLPSLFCNEDAIQEYAILIVNPNHLSSSDSWIQSHNESGVHNIEGKGCSQSLSFMQRLLFSSAACVYLWNRNCH